MAGFSKETSILLIPAYIAFRISKGEKKNTFRDILFATAIILSGFAIPRLLIIGGAESKTPFLRFLKPISLETALRWGAEATFRAWGALTVMPFIFYRSVKNFIKKNPEFLVYLIFVYSMFFPAGEFSARVIAGLGFIAFVPIAMVNVREIIERKILKFNTAAFWLILIQLLFLLYFRISFWAITENAKMILTLVIILFDIFFGGYVFIKARRLDRTENPQKI